MSENQYFSFEEDAEKPQELDLRKIFASSYLIQEGVVDANPLLDLQWRVEVFQFQGQILVIEEITVKVRKQITTTTMMMKMNKTREKGAVFCGFLGIVAQNCIFSHKNEIRYGLAQFFEKHLLRS